MFWLEAELCHKIQAAVPIYHSVYCLRYSLTCPWVCLCQFCVRGKHRMPEAFWCVLGRSACLLNPRWLSETISHWHTTFTTCTVCWKYQNAVWPAGAPSDRQSHAYFTLLTLMKCDVIYNKILSPWHPHHPTLHRVVDRLVYISHLKSLDGDCTLRQWPHSWWCDFEGKGHGVENSDHGESLRWDVLRARQLLATPDFKIDRDLIHQLIEASVLHLNYFITSFKFKFLDVRWNTWAAVRS